MRALGRCILAFVLPLVIACQANTTARVILDLSQALGAAQLPVDSLTVSVTAADMSTQRVSVSPLYPNVELDVPSGAKRRFEVVAMRNDVQPATVTYWGVRDVDLAAGTHAAVDIDVYPAGLLAGSLNFPTRHFTGQAALVATPLQNTPVIGTSWSIPVADGNFTQPLPAGSYQFSTTIDVSGRKYDLDELTVATIVPGTTLEMNLMLEPAGDGNTTARHLAFSSLPSVLSSVGVSAPAFTVSILDAAGDVSTTAAGVVTLELLAADGNATNATLSGTTAVPTVAGVAAFADLIVSTPGTYLLRASMAKLAPVVSGPIGIANISNASTALAFAADATPPTTVAGDTVQLTVSALDALGRVATEYRGTISIFPSDPMAPPTTYTFTEADLGTHSFSFDLRTAGLATFEVVDTSDAEGTSNAVAVATGPLSQMILQIPSTCPGRPCTLDGTLVAADVFGNPVASFVDSVSLSASPNVTIFPATATFTGVASVNAVVRLSASAGLTETIGITPSTHTSLGTSQTILTPVMLGGLSLGLDNSSCAAVSPDYWKCWGDNSAGQLGRADYRQNIGSSPNDMGGHLPLIPFGTSAQTSFFAGLPGAVTQLVAGNTFKCALTSSGGVTCWGNNGSGQLGLGDMVSRRFSAATPKVSLPQTAYVIAAGANHACATLDNSQVICWGDNTYGQLGLGDTLDRLAPPTATVDLGGGRYALALTAGANFNCAQLDDSSVKCWGDNTYGQLGYGDTKSRGGEPNQMGSYLPSVTNGEVVAGARHACAQSSNDVRCWGDNAAGQLGYGDTTNRTAPPQNIVDVNGAVLQDSGLAAGADFTCVAGNAGTYCWGNNNQGQLGLGDTEGRLAPSSAPLPVGKLTQLQAGAAHACGINSADGVVCWGSNSNGQLGYGDTASRGTSKPVNAAAPVVSLD